MAVLCVKKVENCVLLCSLYSGSCTYTKAIQDNTSDTGTEVLFTEHILEFEIRLFGAESLSLTASLKREIFFSGMEIQPLS